MNCKSSPTLASNIPTPAVPTLEAVFVSPEPDIPLTDLRANVDASLSQVTTLSSSEEPGAENPTFAKSCILAAAILASALALVKYRFDEPSLNPSVSYKLEAVISASTYALTDC